MVDWGLSGLSGLSDNLTNLCRLCLQVDDFIVDIFHRLDPNPNKQPLPDRIYDLFQVKVSKSDGLPTNICHRCLYFTESFTEFRDTVRKCEARLQSYVASVGILGSVRMHQPSSKNGIKTEEFDESYINVEDYSNILSNDNSFVTIVDPNQEYESSDDSFSIDSDNEYPIQVPQIIENKKDENNFSYINTDSNENPEGLKNVFLCQYCDMAFTAQIECAEHEARHDAANPHSCNYCPFRCANRQTVIAHIKELHDNDRPYVCVQCNKGFGRRSDLKKHTIVHTGIRPFTCPVCNKNFSRNTNLTKHLRIHTGLKPHVCQKCPRSFTTTADLIRHQRVHSDFKPFQCKKCPSSFSRKDKFLHHEKIHLKKEKSLNLTPNTKVVDPKSPNTSGIFDTEKMVISLDPFSDVNHVESQDHNHESVQSKVPIKAEIPIQDSTPNHITNENKLMNDDYDTCDMEMKTFDHNSSDFPVPERPNDRTHICPVCSKAFLRKRELQRHSVIHTGIKPFACKICNKKFNRKDKVVRHERIHNEDKFSCTQCKIVFSQQETLDMHIKVHNIEKMSPKEENQNILSESINFHNNLQEGFRPIMNFYSEIRADLSED